MQKKSDLNPQLKRCTGALGVFPASISSGAGQGSIWHLSSHVLIAIPDEALNQVEAVAQMVAPGHWACELHGNMARFAFASREAATLFVIAMRSYSPQFASSEGSG
jgi:hypothetical protein